MTAMCACVGVRRKIKPSGKHYWEIRVKGKWAFTIILTARGLKFFKIIKLVNVNRKKKIKAKAHYH